MPATAAGSEVACQCGRAVDVPPLSQLRVMVGDAAYETSTIGAIHRMIRNDELPAGNACAISGQATDDTAVLRIQCERVWTRGSGLDAEDRALIGFFLLGWIGAILGWTKKDTPRKEFGRETYLDVPLRVCSDLQSSLSGKGQTALKSLLRQVPIYDTLLNEYPEAVVIPTKPA